ncbi:MAG: Gfo/Idh/MocA family oxidoreductase [Clostridia bacterium]|nr:Gfo/Idh/MocA family oxidoreductase [Clostridia bacterium]
MDITNIAFAGFRHNHIFGLYNTATENKEVNILGCFENNEEARQFAADTYNIDFNYNSYRELLDDAAVDIVAIGDYYGIRGKMVIEALKAGKHVICDKPICTDIAQLDEIEKLVKETGLQVCCMLDLRYMPQIPKVCELISSGEIGEIINASFTGQHCLDYGNRPGWYFEEGKHGGTINDIAIHGVDIVRFITGKNLTKVNFAKTWNAFAKEEPEFKDCGQFMAEMENMSLMADVSYAAPKFRGIMPTYWDFYFWGTKGMIKFNLKSSTIHIFKTDEEIIECAPSKTQYLQDFLLEIKGEKTIMNTLGILESQRQVLMIQRAAE